MRRAVLSIAAAVVLLAGGCGGDENDARIPAEWEFKTGDVIPTCPTVAPDGTIYIGSHDRHLYALRSARRNGGSRREISCTVRPRSAKTET